VRVGAGWWASHVALPCRWKGQRGAYRELQLLPHNGADGHDTTSPAAATCADEVHFTSDVFEVSHSGFLCVLPHGWICSLVSCSAKAAADGQLAIHERLSTHGAQFELLASAG